MAAVHRGLFDVRHATLARCDFSCRGGLAATGHHHVGGHRGDLHFGRACRGPSRAGASRAGVESTASSYVPDTAARHQSRRQHLETRLTAIDPNDFPFIVTDLAYVRGMVHRQLREEDKAQVWLSKATINGALTEAAKEALADPTLHLVVTDEEAITSRTNSGM